MMVRSKKTKTMCLSGVERGSAPARRQAAICHYRVSGFSWPDAGQSVAGIPDDREQSRADQRRQLFGILENCRMTCFALDARYSMEGCGRVGLLNIRV